MVIINMLNTRDMVSSGDILPPGAWPGARCAGLHSRQGGVDLHLELGGGRHLGHLAGARGGGAAGGAGAGALHIIIIIIIIIIIVTIILIIIIIMIVTIILTCAGSVDVSTVM